MPIENRKTAALTAEDLAGERIASAGKVLLGDTATIEVAAADDDGSVYRLIRVPSNAVITNLDIAADALGTGASYDVGVYEVAANGGVEVDKDEFASGVSLVSAIAWTQILEEAVATDIAKIGQPLWQRLGLTTDPGKAYDICATGNTAGTTAGTISLRLRYYVD
jgi:hypothetical protein